MHHSKNPYHIIIMRVRVIESKECRNERLLVTKVAISGKRTTLGSYLFFENKEIRDHIKFNGCFHRNKKLWTTQFSLLQVLFVSWISRYVPFPGRRSNDKRQASEKQNMELYCNLESFYRTNDSFFRPPLPTHSFMSCHIQRERMY